MTSRAVEPTDAVDHFTDWINWLAPCDFTPMFARRRAGAHTALRMHFVVAEKNFSPEQVARAETQFDLAGAEKKFAGLLWPHVRTVDELMRELAILVQGGDRWTIEPMEWGEKHARPDDVLLSITWRTAAEERTSVMGFMPHGSMPVPRRSPYAALVFWPGARSNPHVEKTEEHVGFIDGDHRIEQYDAYVNVRKASTKRTKSFLTEAPEDVARFRRVAFSLPRRDINPYMNELRRRWSIRAMGRALRQKLEGE